MIMTSYLNKSYLVASWGTYIATIQIIETILSRDINTMTVKHVHAAIDAFLVWLSVKYYDILFHFACIRTVYYKTLIPWLFMFCYVFNVKMTSRFIQNFENDCDIFKSICQIAFLSPYLWENFQMRNNFHPV